MNTDDVVQIHQLMSLYSHYADQRQSAAYRAIGRPLDFADVFVDDVRFQFRGIPARPLPHQCLCQ
jgi:hypothetical protein